MMFRCDIHGGLVGLVFAGQIVRDILVNLILDSYIVLINILLFFFFVYTISNPLFYLTSPTVILNQAMQSLKYFAAAAY
jgi:hypothetical protein